MIPYAQGVGFAIPINAVKRVVQQIFEKGRVVRPWLGISGVNLNLEIARRYNLQAQSGVLVASVSREGPAYEAGLRQGDVIVRVGQTEIKAMKDLLLSLSKFEVGSVISIEYLRLGAMRQTTLRLTEVPTEMQNYLRRN